MTCRIIQIKNEAQARQEMLRIGVDPAGIKLMAAKAVMRVVKLEKVSPTAANIIKQDILALGGEAATSRGTINHSVKETAVLIFATEKQLRLLLVKMKMGYFGLPQAAHSIEEARRNSGKRISPVRIGSRLFEFGKQTYIMGILNVTPDSFSDGGKYDEVDAAVARAEALLEAGADIIDIGGESTRPGAATVPARQEIERVVPVIKILARDRRKVMSVDTRKAAVARAALRAGAQMVNDVSGLRYDPKLARVIGSSQAAVCIMHSQGSPKTMQKKPLYSDLMGEIISYLDGGLAIAKKNGILLGKIIVDPGIGFGKTVEHNLEIINKLDQLRSLGCPVMIGPSRKSFIGKIMEAEVSDRLEGTAAAVALSIANGADMVRVHDVSEMKKVARLTDAIVRREII